MASLSLLLFPQLFLSFLYFWFAVVAVAAAKERNAEDVESAFVTFFVAAVVVVRTDMPDLERIKCQRARNHPIYSPWDICEFHQSCFLTN